MKKSLLGFLAVILAISSAEAVLSINYDNATGEYEFSGSDTGHGSPFDLNRRLFAWTFGSTAERELAEMILTEVGNSAFYFIGPGVIGQATLDTVYVDGNSTGFVLITSTSGSLSVLGTGTITAGIADGLGDGQYVGAPLLSTNTDEPLTITVSSVPELSSYGVLLGFAAIGFVAGRRQKQHRRRI